MCGVYIFLEISIVEIFFSIDIHKKVNVIVWFIYLFLIDYKNMLMPFFSWEWQQNLSLLCPDEYERTAGTVHVDNLAYFSREFCTTSDILILITYLLYCSQYIIYIIYIYQHCWAGLCLLTTWHAIVIHSQLRWLVKRCVRCDWCVSVWKCAVFRVL